MTEVTIFHTRWVFLFDKALLVCKKVNIRLGLDVRYACKHQFAVSHIHVEMVNPLNPAHKGKVTARSASVCVLRTCVCVNVCEDVFITSTCCTHTPCTHIHHVHTCTHMHTHMDTNPCTHMHTHIYSCTHIHTHPCAHMHTSIHVHPCTHTCTHTLRTQGIQTMCGKR